MRELGRSGTLALLCALAVPAPRSARAEPAGPASEHVVTLSTPTPAVGVCVASPADLPPLPIGISRVLATRGGRVDTRADRWTRCLEVPAGEHALGLWAARSWLTAPASHEAGEVDTRALARLQELAAAGATRDDRAVIVLAGAATRGAGSISRRATSTPPGDKPQRSERLSVLEDARVAAPELWVGYATSGASPREAIALGLVVEMLGAPQSGRLPRLLVTARHRATHASARLECIRGTPLLVAHVSVAPHSSVDRVDRYVVSTLKQLRIAGPSESELDGARRRFATRMLHAAERPVDRARLVAERLTCGHPDEVDELVARAAAVTASDVQGVVRRFLAPTRRSLVEVYPPDWPQDDASLRAHRLHTVREGETWTDVATVYGVPATSIAAANELHVKYRLGAGQILWIPPARTEPAGARGDAQAASAPSSPSRR